MANKKTPSLSKIRPKHVFGWPEVTLLASITILSICICVSLAASAAFDPARDAEHALTRLADDYYIEYLYPTLLGYEFDDPAATLSSYHEAGLPLVRLRQITSADLSSAHLSRYFDTTNYYCDKNSTTIRFYPDPPYGPRNYHVTYTLNCQFKTP